jgi:hypothetical protein
VQIKDVTIEELPEPKPGEIFIGAPPSSIGPDHKSAARSAQDQLGTFALPQVSRSNWLLRKSRTSPANSSRSSSIKRDGCGR